MTDSKTLVIAEAGANHDRDWAKAQRLVRVAAASGADIVKFQTYTSADLYSSETPDFAGHRDIPSLIKSIELPRAWQRDLKLMCDDTGIEFMSTPFDERAVEELVEIGVKRLKVASFEATDPRILRCVASTGLPLIISIGVGSSPSDAKVMLETVLDVNPEPDVTFLHCNSAYPTPHADICLGQMLHLMEFFRCSFGHDKVKFGLSDHTEGILVPPIAVTHGAQVIEKHFTLSRKSKGPDHPFAIEPDELFKMVADIRLAETVMGTRRPGLSQSEADGQMAYALRSVVTSRGIGRGEILDADNVTTKRPYLPGAVPASEYYRVIGSKRTTRTLWSDTVIGWCDLEDV